MVQQTVSPQILIVYKVSISQMKVIDIHMMIQIYYCYKMPIIIRDMGLRTWGGGLKSRKWVRKLKVPFQVLLLFKHYNFWSIGWYQSSFINLTENSQVLILKFTQWPTNVYWRISIFREMKFWFVFPKKSHVCGQSF